MSHAITRSTDAPDRGLEDHFRMDDVERARSKLHELEYTADVGESPRTPLILLGEAWLICAVVVVIITALSLLAYRLAT